MKKPILLYVFIALVVLGLAAAGYWYWQNQPEEVLPLEQVALDNPDIKSFDDVCSEKDEYELECKGNIEQFGCERYHSIGDTLENLNPSYPMLICEKKYDLSEAGIYRIEKQVPLGPSAYKMVDYIIIKNNTFQLIVSEQQFVSIFQPIDSVAEATDYFKALHKSWLLFNDKTLAALKQGNQEQYRTPISELTTSSVSETNKGFLITSYSQFKLQCVDTLYKYTHLLKYNGVIIEKDRILIWESKFKPACIN